tara:strand:- start:1658 stop:2077 length:420 start_codon:yes stop_codon:yes gene_type:complete
MSIDKEYDEYCKRAGIENRNIDPGSLAYITEQQQKAYYQNVAQREDMRPNQAGLAQIPTSPIRSAVELLDLRITQLQAVTDRLFISLKPVTTNTDDNHPAETRASKQGNSPLNIDLNATADRLEVITAALQLQIDRLEV